MISASEEYVRNLVDVARMQLKAADRCLSRAEEAQTHHERAMWLDRARKVMRGEP